MATQIEKVINTLGSTVVKGVEPEKQLSIIIPLLKWLENVSKTLQVNQSRVRILHYICVSRK